MLFPLPELSGCVWISGFNGKPDDLDTTLRSIQERFPDVTAQLVDLDRVPGSRYMLLATLNALKSFHSKQPIAKTLGLEMLLYIAADRQISEALRHVGITPATERVAAILVGKVKDEVSDAALLLAQILHQKGDDTVVDDWSPDRTKNVLSIFRIGSKELKATMRAKEAKTEAIERLATERSALLTIRK